jgi:DNA-binding NtrC family response regulator
MPAPHAASESVSAVLARFGGRRDAAADYLGISRTTLWRKLRAEGQAVSGRALAQSSAGLQQALHQCPT